MDGADGSNPTRLTNNMPEHEAFYQGASPCCEQPAPRAWLYPEEALQLPPSLGLGYHGGQTDAATQSSQLEDPTGE